MYSNIMEIKFPNKSDNERFARTVAAESDGGGSGGCQDGDFGGGYKCDNSRI